MDNKMKRERTKEGKFKKRSKLWAVIPILFVLIGLWFMFMSLMKWHDNNEIVFNKVIRVQLDKPMSIVRREKEIVRPLVIDVEVKTPTEMMICETFGQWECKTALAVAQAESGMRTDALHYNTNGTYDVGLFQINSIHWDKEGCSLAELVTEKGNVDCAKQIFDASGWGAWSVVNNGSVGRHL